MRIVHCDYRHKLTRDSEPAITSYDEAATSCKSKVEAIVEECTRLNVKYNDQVFRLPYLDTLQSLAVGPPPDSLDSEGDFTGSVKRVEVRDGNKSGMGSPNG